jgi:hypothetical protein
MTATVWLLHDAGPHIMVTSSNLGATSGGTSMIITGRGFVTSGSTKTKVYFGDREAASVEVAANTTIIAVSPAGDPGNVAVTVVNPDGRRTTQPDAFTYGEPNTIPAVSD